MGWTYKDEDYGTTVVANNGTNEAVYDKYEDKIYKIIKVPFNISSGVLSSDSTAEALEILEAEVNDYMENASEDYTPVGIPTVIGGLVIQVLVDEDYV